MKTVAVIQARMGSTRLPGKVMLPLAGESVLQHVVNRVKKSKRVDQTVLATTREKQDDIIARFAPRFGAKVYRGSETDVLERIFQAARSHNADVVVRVTADCPLLDPEVIDVTIRIIEEKGVHYCSNIQMRSFPRGLDIESFSYESFSILRDEAAEPHHREHVTPYYRENPDKFDIETVTSNMIYGESSFRNRTDLRLTLDEAADYELLDIIYSDIKYDDILPVKEAIRYVDEHNLKDINSDIEQKPVIENASDHPS